MIICEYRQGTTCLQATEMAGATASTTDGACNVCLAESTRINSVTASLALHVIPHPRPADKKYLVGLLKRVVCPNQNAIEKGNVGPVSSEYTRSRPEFRKYSDVTLDLYHSLWAELHSIHDPTPEWFARWLARVPQASCGCRKWLAEYIDDHPPDYDDFARWSVDLHNAVNAKLGKPIWPENKLTAEE